MNFEQDINILDEELRISTTLVVTGLRELNRDGAARHFFHLPIQLVSTGLDRFIKTIVAMHILKTTGEIPSGWKFTPSFKRLPTHNLRWTVSQLIEKRVFDDNHYLAPGIKEELQFLLADERTQKLIDILMNYSMGANYYNINLIYGVVPPGICQAEELEQLRMEIWEEELGKYGAPLTPKDYDLVDKLFCWKITTSCELFMRTLTRLISWGSFKSRKEEVLAYTEHFLYLNDDNLGMTDYASLYTTPSHEKQAIA